MIFPVVCFTCGKVIGNMWKDYENKLQIEFNKKVSDYENSMDIDEKEKNTIENETLDNLGVKRICCHRMCLYHEDLFA